MIPRGGEVCDRDSGRRARRAPLATASEIDTSLHETRKSADRAPNKVRGARKNSTAGEVAAKLGRRRNRGSCGESRRAPSGRITPPNCAEKRKRAAEGRAR